MHCFCAKSGFCTLPVSEKNRKYDVCDYIHIKISGAKRKNDNKQGEESKKLKVDNDPDSKDGDNFVLDTIGNPNSIEFTGDSKKSTEVKKAKKKKEKAKSYLDDL